MDEAAVLEESSATTDYGFPMRDRRLLVHHHHELIRDAVDN
jgi:hypothetical protein